MSARDDYGHFHMADVGDKRITARRAVAVGELAAGSAFDAIVGRRLPKGDAIMMAEIAGLQGAKNASQLIPMCHPLPIEHVDLCCEPLPSCRSIRVYCEVTARARTGVEMEALAGVNAALLTLYDLSKPIEPALAISGVRLLFKEGGKKGLWLHPAGMNEEQCAHYRPRAPARLEGVSAAVFTLSDRASRGVYEDRSGPLLVRGLEALGARVERAELLPDDPDALAAGLHALAAAGIRLVLCTGGTGIGPRDRTPEALARAADRRIAGLGEMFRSESSQHTSLAWLSRAEAVAIGETLVIALPGNPRAVVQGLDILAPVLAHALEMLAEGGQA